MNKIAIFADGGPDIGMGHLTRMQSLITRLDVASVFFTRTPDMVERVFDPTVGTKIEIVALENPFDLPSRLEKEYPAVSLLLLDPPIDPDNASATTGPTWCKFVNAIKALGKPVIRFTDEPRATRHNTDMLVNDHPNAADFVDEYKAGNSDIKLLTGLQFFLIDPEHDNAESAHHEGIFICFGGGDQSGLVEHFAPAVREIAKNSPVDLVVGAACGDIEVTGENVTVHRDISPAQFASLLKGTHLAITAAGNTMIERVFHQRPGISVAQFDHQNYFGTAFAERHLTVHLGIGIDISPNDLVTSAEQLYHDDDARDAQISAARTHDIRSGCSEIVSGVRSFLDS
ncbi:MAG: hypothetical protein CMM48_08440 [Rhodospirillaceae bacterium]|nr:hypothetical protein [Rhodospirillaceae bacterium]HAA93597.1 hypothetical protein [Rhodospirillaceae bacterium]